MVVKKEGPRFTREVEASNGSVRDFYIAQLEKTTVSAGPAKATIGLAADTGYGISPTQIEGKVLGTGISIGRKVGFSVFGTGVEFKLW